MHLADAFIQSDLHCIQVSFTFDQLFYPGLSQSSVLPRWLPAQADTSLISVGLLWQLKDPAVIPIWCLG